MVDVAIDGIKRALQVSHKPSVEQGDRVDSQKFEAKSFSVNGANNRYQPKKQEASASNT